MFPLEPGDELGDSRSQRYLWHESKDSPGAGRVCPGHWEIGRVGRAHIQADLDPQAPRDLGDKPI
jgi:hypothetical protein